MNRKRIVIGLASLVVLLGFSAAQATVLFALDDIEGWGGVGSPAPATWGYRGASPYARLAGHSGSYSADCTADFMALIPYQDEMVSYEAWVYVKNDVTAALAIGIWLNTDPAPWTPGPRAAFRDDGYVKVVRASDDTWVSTGVTWTDETWYHVGLQYNGLTAGTYDFFISTTDNLGTAVITDVPYAITPGFDPLTGGANASYQKPSSAWFAAGVFVDDATIYTGAIPEPATMVVLALGGLAMVFRRMRLRRS